MPVYLGTVENDTDGVIADRLQPDDADMGAAGHQAFFGPAREQYDESRKQNHKARKLIVKISDSIGINFRKEYYGYANKQELNRC